MKKIFALLLALAMALSLVACGSGNMSAIADTAAGAPVGGHGFSSNMKGEAAMDGGDYDYDYEEDVAYEESVSESEAPAESDSGSAYDRANVKLIRRASLEVETLSFDDATAELEALVEQLGGYIEDSSLYQGGYGSTYRSADYTVRIPSEKYDAFLNRMGKSESCRLVNKSESTEDVGQAYFDAENRLKTLRTKLKRLQELLAEAKKMEDIITLESAISETEYAIDLYASDLKRYDSLIGYSTFNISIEQVRTPSDSESMSFGDRLSNAFLTGCENFRIAMEDFALLLAENIFGLLLLAVIVFVLRLLYKRKASAKPKAKKQRRFGRRKKDEGAVMVVEQPEEKSSDE